MLFCPMTRSNLLQLLPKGGEGAEIGVASGGFSHEIMTEIRPRKLHLIDPWEHQDRADYLEDRNNVAGDEQEGRYRKVAADFAAEIAEGRVEIHRAYSGDAAARFAEGQLDWVYIDGLHTYEGCTADLQLYKDKVKPDGLIMGHDYTNHIEAQRMGFGVVEAVNDFVCNEGYEFVLLTHEPYPTYVLARDLEGGPVRELMGRLFLNLPRVIEMRDFPQAGAFVHKLVQVGGEVKTLPSF